MNFAENETAQKLRGGFYTEPDIASFLVRWVNAIKPGTVVEPSCGDGAFLSAIEGQHVTEMERVTAFEINPDEAEKARQRTSPSACVTASDFLRWFLMHGMSHGEFDAVVGNPPFIRYQYLPDGQQLLAQEIFNRLKLPFKRHTNAWVPFVLASIRLLRPGGRLGMVVPSEIFHIPHAISLRRYLAEQCSRILILDPEEIWFGRTLQGTVLLLAEKKKEATEKGLGVAVLRVSDRSMLNDDPEPYFRKAIYADGVVVQGKWMTVFLSDSERGLLGSLRRSDMVKTFAELASVDVGIVTGANKFFLVPDSVVDEFGLSHWAHPMFGRSYHVKGLVYSRQDHMVNKQLGLPANFLWFNGTEEQALKQAQEYLATGLAQKLHRRYKCRTRSPWYTVPSVYKAPIGMLKRANDYHRLVLNYADAYTTDTAYRIQPTNTDATSLVLSFVNSLTCLMAEIEGRHYGGGVLELVPSEIERLLIPVVNGSRSQLKEADQRFRNAKTRTEFLLQQDARILGGIGLTVGERQDLHSAWSRLHDRRQRIPSVPSDHEMADAEQD